MYVQQGPRRQRRPLVIEKAIGRHEGRIPGDYVTPLDCIPEMAKDNKLDHAWAVEHHQQKCQSLAEAW
jgi:hypothetical protein